MLNIVNMLHGDYMKRIEEIVHIIPLGHEIDRAVKPFEKFKANRVHLLAVIENRKYAREMLDKQKYFLNIVRQKLKEKDIEIIVKNVDMFDMLDVMKNVSSAILEEKHNRNIVYVNISACGRLTSVGTALAAMAHDAKVYYVVADKYSKTPEEELTHGLSICENLNIVFLENFKFALPDETGLKILAKLCEKEKGMKTNELLNLLRQSSVEGFEKDYQKLLGEQKRKTHIAYLIKLNKKILDKLESNGYIIREKVGKYNTIRITESGKYLAHISGLLK